MTHAPGTAARVVAWVVGVALLVGVVHVVRTNTQSRHEEMPDDSRLRVVVEPMSNRAEASQDLTDLATAQLEYCDLEVGGDIEGDPEVVGQDPLLLAVTLAPALDATDRKQFRGCVEDWLVDNHLLRVRSMEEHRLP